MNSVGLWLERTRRACRTGRESSPVAASEPGVFARRFVPIPLDPVPHGQGAVRLVVHQPRDERDRRPRNELPHEHHTAPRLAPDVTADVEAEVHFLKGPMPRDGESEDAGLREQKANDADVQRTAPAIHFYSRGYQRFQQLWADLVVEHDEIAPLGSQKHTLRWRCRRRWTCRLRFSASHYRTSSSA